MFSANLLQPLIMNTRLEVNAHLNEARAARGKDLFDLSIESYKAAIAAQKDSWDIRYELAIYYAVNSKPAEAIYHFKLLIEQYPEHPQLLANLATALAESEQPNEAVIYFRKALSLNPQLIELAVPLSESLRRLGRYEDALESLRHLLNAAPKNHAAFCTMGLVYRDMGDLPRALESFENAVGLEKNQPFYRLQFAYLLLKAQLPDKAESQITSALDLQPDWVEALGLYAEILEADKRRREAINIYDHLLKLDPFNLEIKVKKAEIFFTLGLHEQAATLLNSVLGEKPDHQGALLDKFNVLRELGSNASIREAKGLVKNYHKAYPDDLEAYRMDCCLHKYPLTHPAVLKLRASIEGQSKFSIISNMALAKVMEDNQAWDQAFEIYRNIKKNTEKDYLDPYVSEFAEKRTDEIISFFNEDTVKRLSKFASHSNTTVLIFGMARAGKTVTANLLSCHKAIESLDEVDYWNTAFDSLKNEQKLSYPHYVDYIQESHATAATEGYEKLLKSFVASSKIVDTYPYNFEYLGLIATLFPNATLLHAERNILDTCLYIYFKSFQFGHEFANDLVSIAHYYQQYKRLMNHWHKIFPGRIHNLVFEEIVNDPDKQFHRLLEMIGLPLDDELIDRTKLKAIVSDINCYQSSINHWRHYEKHLGPLKEGLLGLLK